MGNWLVMSLYNHPCSDFCGERGYWRIETPWPCRPLFKIWGIYPIMSLYTADFHGERGLNLYLRVDHVKKGQNSEQASVPRSKMQ